MPLSAVHENSNGINVLGNVPLGTTKRIELGPGDALLIVDVQNDFLPGGSLPVPGGEAVVPILNGYLEQFVSRQLPIFASRDWHPADHCSFQQRGGPWPAHCVVGTWGAVFAVDLRLPPDIQLVSKAVHPERDSYSDFEETSLRQQLENQGVHRLFIGGLATEYCVQATVSDARALGYEVFLLVDAIRAIDTTAGNRAVQQMIRQGAVPTRFEQLIV